MPGLTLPEKLYTAEGCRTLDSSAIALSIPGDTLMERAGKGAFAVIRRNWPDARRLLVCCGGGNNGGDGYVVARLAHQASWQPVIYAMVDEGKLKGDALTMAQRAREAGIPITDDLGEALSRADVVVDAMLGTGISGAPRENYARVIHAINASGLPVLAIDIPSGLQADTGATPGDTILATSTVTFIGVKQGLLTGQGPLNTGRLYFDDLRVPAEVYEQVPYSCERPDHADIARALPPRPRIAHKGHFGHVLIVGGDHGYAGAAMMAAQAAARCGAGLVSVATRQSHCAAMLVRQPELMVHGVESTADLESLLEKATVLVVGPGLGQGDWGRALLQQVLASEKKKVLDADALNLLAVMDNKILGAQSVLTPHPGEAARLLNCTTTDIQNDRFAALQNIVSMTGATVLLKGAGTLIGAADDKVPALISFGNPGMATGGMGDILSGVVAALFAQGLDARNAAVMAALTHSVAADSCAVEEGERGMLATDLLTRLRSLLNGLY